MASGKLDREYGIQEGWVRDTEDEVGIDGYNAFISVTTRDGTSGFQVYNDIGAVVFSSKSDGDGYVAKNLGIGTYSPAASLDVRGLTQTHNLRVTVGATSGYVLTSDNEGNAIWQPPDAAEGLLLDGYVTEQTFQENKQATSEAIQTILGDLDGYAQTEQEHHNQHSDAIQTILKDLDGYITPEDHRALDQLVHIIAETSYEELSYSGGKVTNMTIWTDVGKTTKIREEQFTYDNNSKVTQAIIIQYDIGGLEVERLTESFTYSGNQITSITRTLT